LKIGIYSSASRGSIGGAECSIAVLAEAFGQYHDVEIVHHRPSLAAQQLEKLFDVDLSAVGLRYVAPESNSFGDSRWPARRYEEAREWHRSVSSPYELFINFTHYMPPFCQAPMGVLMVLFPFYDPLTSWPARADASDTSSRFWKSGRGLYYNWEWKRRMASYGLKLANSHFTAKWTMTRWGVKAHVLYPPVDVNFPLIEKENLILTVGRFTPLKKQLEMVSTFLQLSSKELQEWTCICAGTVGDSPSAGNYYKEVRGSAAGSNVQFAPDIDRLSLKGLFERSKVFWHAAGLDEDDSVRPELSEHFGMATVEAMAAGSVPVVINKGGQREIVEHGVNGFLWNTLDDLREYTVQLAKNESLRARMSDAARIRARCFSREKFVEHFRAYIEPFFPKSDLRAVGGPLVAPKRSMSTGL
jgi:glycosyltransferase involved in cell wall biosynthesis